LPENP
jgi:hypothetical protein